MAEPWSVEFYVDSRGERPVAQFIESLRSNPKLRSKILSTIDLLKEFGIGLPGPYSAAMVGYDFRELRVRHGSDIARIVYAAIPGRKIVLLHNFQKKSQATPRRELETARRRLEELRGRL